MSSVSRAVDRRDGHRVVLDVAQSAPFVHATVVFDTLGALWKARALCRSSDAGALRLCPVRSVRPVGTTSLSQLVRTIDRIVGALTRWSRHQCFYLSYVRGVVLRKRGFPLELNIGLRNLAAGSRTRGHCWLTLDGRPFADPEDPGVKYPTELGLTRAGVRCWLGPEIRSSCEDPATQVEAEVVEKVHVAVRDLWRLA